MIKINREIPNQRKPKNQRFDICFIMFLNTFYETVKIILWSIRTFWYKGSSENKDKWQVRMASSKKAYTS